MNRPGTVAYSDEEISRVANWLREGLSASKIAERLGNFRHQTVTRNAVIGLVRRNKVLKAIGLTGHPSGGRKGGRPMCSSPPKPRCVESEHFYSEAEIESIAGWLTERKSAAQISVFLALKHGRKASGRAIAFLVQRHPKLQEIGTRSVVISPFERRPPADVFVASDNNSQVNRYTYDDESRRVPLAALGVFDCRWPVNDAGPGEQHLFCGLAADGGPYCRHHARRAGAGYSAAEYRQRQVA